MKAGKLDRKIAIEREAETVDANGTVVRAWTPVATVAAQRVQQSTDEFLETFGENVKTAIVFRIRYRPGVELSDRIVYEGTAFNLVETKEIGRRVGLELRCEAKS